MQTASAALALSNGCPKALAFKLGHVTCKSMLSQSGVKIRDTEADNNVQLCIVQVMIKDLSCIQEQEQSILMKFRLNLNCIGVPNSTGLVARLRQARARWGAMHTSAMSMFKDRPLDSQSFFQA